MSSLHTMAASNPVLRIATSCATQTNKVGYQGVTKSQLANVVLSEGSVTWQGDFTNFER